MSREIRLVAASKEDSRFLWKWRNDPKVRRNFFTPDLVAWEDHHAWFSQKLKNSCTKIYIAIHEEDRVGVIRFEIGDKDIGVSVNLNPTFFNRGFGSIIIKCGTDKFLEETRINKPIAACIKKNNIASQKAFAKAKYKMIEKKEEKIVYKYDIAKKF